MNKSMLTYFSIGLVVIVVIVVVAAKLNATANPRTENATNQANQEQADQQEVEVEDIATGEGAEAQLGSTITVRYTGTLEDGTVFDTTGDGEPRTFDLVQGGLIEGWIEGIPGMKEGGKRRLVIPAAKGYGTTGQGSIPPNATLIFEIELISVQQPE